MTIALKFIDGMGEVAAQCFADSEASSSTFVARDPSWTAVVIPLSAESVIMAAGGPERHFAVIRGEEGLDPDDATISGVTRDGRDMDFHLKKVVEVTVENDAGIDCGCTDTDAHAVAGETALTLKWDWPVPVKLWIDMVPVAGPVGGMCISGTQFTPPYSGRLHVRALHPRYYFKPVIVHSIEPIPLPDTEVKDGSL